MKFVAIAAVTLLAAAPPAWADGDAAAGATKFKVCTTCHSAGEGAKNKIGPVLNDVVGRQPGTFPQFPYSKAMKDFGASNPAWTPKLLAKFLHKPKDEVPGTKMTFAGMSDEKDVENVIAYLKSLSPGYKGED